MGKKLICEVCKKEIHPANYMIIFNWCMHTKCSDILHKRMQVLEKALFAEDGTAWWDLSGSAWLLNEDELKVVGKEIEYDDLDQEGHTIDADKQLAFDGFIDEVKIHGQEKDFKEEIGTGCAWLQ